jgi:MFS transporter, DHA1 family, inner membrane transport protein
MAFFRNRVINLLNLHYGIHTVALSGGGAFFATFLLKSGVSTPGVLSTIALILLGRFVIRPLVISFTARHGLRAMVIAGTVLSALQYPFLAEVHGADFALAMLIAIASVGDTVYWTTYHAYFAVLGDDELRGSQIGVREAIGAAVGVVSPLLAGWMLVNFGPRVAFGLTAIIAVLSALPFLWAPDVRVARSAPGAFRAAAPGIALFAADGWTAAGCHFVWQIALFISLGESFVAFGGALAFSALVGALGGLTLGRHIDAGHGRRAVWFAMGTLALMVTLRAIATGNGTLAVLANALGAFSACVYIPTVMTAVYTLAKRAPCTLRFHVAAEGGWDIGGASGLLVSAGAIAYGLPLAASILLSLAGVATTALLLRRYYAVGPVVAAAE